MALNPYFHHTNAVEEQDLFHDIVTEMVQIGGIEVYYIKTDGLSGNYDELFGENRFQNLENATPIEMYLDNMEKPYGGDDIYSKFGLTQNQTCTFLVGYRRFEEEFGGRPREGDFIYIPLFSARTADDVFRITSVDVDNQQYQPLGTSLFYHINAERATFSHENVNTGVDVIDFSGEELVNDDSVENDKNADNDLIEGLGDLFINFDETNPFGNP